MGNNIDPVEYYEKYFLVDGKPAPPLSEWDKDFLRTIHKMTQEDIQGVIIIRGRQIKRTLFSKVLEQLKSLKG